MPHLRNSVLATLAYYDIFDFPLTLFEINKYLINPARLNLNVKSSVFNIKASDIFSELDNMVKAGIIGHKNGFYFLPGRDAVYELRMEREKIAARKWKKFLRIAKWFQAVPYLRGVMASGSMAICNTDKNSDFDVLAVVASGRLYTCRVFLSIAASLFGARRKRFDKIAPDKFCFNHYIIDRNMTIKHESLFNAQTYINLKPVIMRRDFFENFYSQNLWLNKYVYNFRPAYELARRSVKPSRTLRRIASLGEFILNNKFGDQLEGVLKKYQHRRIRSNPVTYEKGGRIVFNDNELEFHPHSFEARAIDKYNKTLKNLGIILPEDEKDSGGHSFQHGPGGRN